MKILNTRNGKFGRFVKKNGAFLVLGLVVVSVSLAVFMAAGRGNKPSNNINSNINLSGDENKWNTSSQKDAQQTDVPQQPSSQLQPSEQSSSSLKPSNSSDSQETLSSSQELQEILFISPLNAEVLNAFSGDKPVRSKTMGDWRIHTGIDLAAEKGKTVCSAAEGTVSKVYTDNMWGTTVEIEHPNGMTSIYSSLSDKVFVEKGQKVTSKQAIGTVGNTARVESAENSHLHFAIKKDGKYIDPQSVITKKIGEN